MPRYTNNYALMLSNMYYSSISDLNHSFRLMKRMHKCKSVTNVVQKSSSQAIACHLTTCEIILDKEDCSTNNAMVCKAGTDLEH